MQHPYTGSAGKKANFPIGVSLVLATAHAELPVDFKLYIPQAWADACKRCRAAHTLDGVGGESKWELALDMIESAVKAQLPRGVVLADSAYGHKGGFREGLEELGLEFAVGVKSNASVRRVGARRRLGTPMSVKGQLGLDHYEGRSFVDWNHHVSVALACDAFLVAEGARSFPPSEGFARASHSLECAA